MATKLFNNIKDLMAHQELPPVVIATQTFPVIAFKAFSVSFASLQTPRNNDELLLKGRSVLPFGKTSTAGSDLTRQLLVGLVCGLSVDPRERGCPCHQLRSAAGDLLSHPNVGKTLQPEPRFGWRRVSYYQDFTGTLHPEDHSSAPKSCTSWF